jgi:glucose/arabinose dehydrogenase
MNTVYLGKWVLTTALFLAAGLAAAQNAGKPVVAEVVARGLENPWAVAFVGPGQMLVTERPGRMRLVHSDGRVGPPIAGVPEVDAVGQGGLLDLITDSDFARNRTVYFCYAEPAARGNGNSTAMARARLSDDGTRLEDLRVIFSQQPKVSSRLHFGCRIVEMPDGHLMLALGDRFFRMQDAQTLDNHHGKVVRVSKDGRVPGGNPLAGRSGALPEIWSWGHRNPQGATLGPDGRLWVVEHGPQGGDEINRPEAGKNYGWPVVTFGENYGGGAIGEGNAKPGMKPPLHHWTPSIAPAGMAFVTTDRYGSAWRGSLLVGSLKFQYLARLTLDGLRVVGEERLLTNLRQRVRDVRQAPDGTIYLLTDQRDGQLLRLQP